MTTKTNSLRALLTDPVDLLLADVAIRVQLSQTDYNKAVSRYRTINDWIERAGSPLKDRVQLFYPQGSMVIGATIASQLRTDEFDIDVVAQLDLPVDVSPREPLDLLYEAIRGEPGSRYYGMVKRRTRCVTVAYRDDMHLDVTPMLRMWGTLERQSWIFHHRAEAPREPSYRLIANPYGFAEWFKNKTPMDHEFANVFEERAKNYEQLSGLMEADSDPVPPQEPPFRKSRAVIVLQLLKRWRNVQYDSRPGRRPPSIMIAKACGRCGEPHPQPFRGVGVPGEAYAVRLPPISRSGPTRSYRQSGVCRGCTDRPLAGIVAGSSSIHQRS